MTNNREESILEAFSNKVREDLHYFLTGEYKPLGNSDPEESNPDTEVDSTADAEDDPRDK